MATTISGDTGVSQVQDGVIQTADIAPLAVTPEKMSQKLTLATAQNTTSGTAIDFTGIPSWAKRITVMFESISTNGSSPIIIQLGVSGGFEITSYVSVCNTFNASPSAVETTTGFAIALGLSTSIFTTGLVTIASQRPLVWCESHSLRTSAPAVSVGGGMKTLSGTLDRLRITTVNGTDTFDAGSVNIMYEG
jgi:hypothetical protein